MKAITYLQNLGAIPQFQVRDLQLAVVVIVSELFDEGMMVEPDCVGWTQKQLPGDGLTAFSERCEIIAAATNGDLDSLLPLLRNLTDLEDLKDLIEELLEIRLFYFSLYKGAEPPSEDEDRWFVTMYNEMVSLNPQSEFETKSQILRFFFSGSLNEVGEMLLKSKGVKL